MRILRLGRLNFTFPALAAALTGLLIAIAASPARADTVAFSNLVNGYCVSIYCGSNLDLGSIGAGYDGVWANEFQVTTSGTLVSAQLSLISWGAVYGSDNNPVTLYLKSNGGSTPGAVLATFTQQGSIPGGSGLTTFNCDQCPFLTTGTDYWIEAYQSDANSTDTWEEGYGPLGVINVAGNYSGNPDGNWSLYTGNVAPGGMRVYVDPTPEPTPAVLLLTGLLGLFFYEHHRRGAAGRV